MYLIKPDFFTYFNALFRFLQSMSLSCSLKTAMPVSIKQRHFLLYSFTTFLMNTTNYQYRLSLKSCSTCSISSKHRNVNIKCKNLTKKQEKQHPNIKNKLLFFYRNIKTICLSLVIQIFRDIACIKFYLKNVMNKLYS